MLQPEGAGLRAYYTVYTLIAYQICELAIRHCFCKIYLLFQRDFSADRKDYGTSRLGVGFDTNLEDAGCNIKTFCCF